MKGEEDDPNDVGEAKEAPPRKRKHYNIPILLSLSLFSYGGEFLRWFTEQLFGLSCHEPDTHQIFDWAPCTTAPGNTSATGGAFFTDLPANVLGCFLMGFFVSGDSDVLPVDLPMAFLGRTNPFQQWKITHLGLRTGFCGALTTFASWNTQMVIMLCGGEGTELGSSQWVSVIWGYLVGWMIAMESFRVGRDVAHALSRRNNPELAKEADVVREQEELGVFYSVNRELPDFERRFLHDIMIEEEEEEEEKASVVAQTVPEELPNSPNSSKTRTKPVLLRRKSSLIDDYGSVTFSMGARVSSTENVPKKKQSTTTVKPNLRRYGNKNDNYHEKYRDHVHHLQRWKNSTEDDRKAGSPYAQELHEIEHALLVENQEPREELLSIIRDAGWNYDALKRWKDVVNPQELLEAEDEAMRDRSTVELPLHALLFFACTGLLIWGAIHFDDGDDPINNIYRTQFLSALLSPPGTIIRWLLSKWNGMIQHKNWEWLPIGTLAANLLASVISVLMPALTLHTDASPLGDAFMGAMKTGFAGSLSTVSTFAAETVGLFRALPRYFWGYYYSFGSLILAAILGVISYVWTAA